MRQLGGIDNLVMDNAEGCRDCAADAGLQWPADTSKYWSGSCHSCGNHNNTTLVPFKDMEEITA
jgi:hypothetical protein